MGKGLANLAAAAFSGYPVGGSFSRSALNRLSGARTRWSGLITGIAVLAVLPFASILSDLPKAAMAGLVIASVIPLLTLTPVIRAWRLSRPQFGVAIVTLVVSIAAAPQVQWGVIAGVACAFGGAPLARTSPPSRYLECPRRHRRRLNGEANPARAPRGRALLRLRPDA